MKYAEPYTLLAPYYEEMMSHINYEGWAAYIIDILLTYTAGTSPMVLEVAGGTGKMSNYIRKVFSQLFVTEYSTSMLKSNPQRGYFTSCDMLFLPFRQSFNAVYCTFDSVNYLLSQLKLRQMFREINRVLKPGGIFCFDVSLEKNSLKYERSVIFNENLPEGIISQKSIYNKISRIHYNYFYFSDGSGNIVAEKHKQKIYELNVFFDLFRLTGFELVKCYKAFTYKKGKASDDRVFFIIRKL